MPGDIFPQTLVTWIGEEAKRGPEGLRAVNRYLMSTYAWPIRVYYLGTNSTWLGEADEVVNDFFANRLAREEFIPNWMASGLRLRRWLMNAFCFYLKERRRRQLAHPTVSRDDDDDPATTSGNPQREVEVASAVAFVRQAMAETEAACRNEGMGDHWQIFRLHHIDEIPFRTLGQQFGVDEARANVMSRTAARKFRTALQEVLRRDGVAEQDMDAEINTFLEVTSR
jgi:DNA-directed RNA polymerase specialized sigma24 family protein